jgi:DNA (cytosine-5)-methyltransferase 1
MARLHGFPDWFRFHVTKWHGAREIGNAVAPPLARAIGAEIIKAMDLAPSRPNRVLEPGPKWLLQMDGTLAARHWGVANPIGRRDKKSGATKRKQNEIEAERVASHLVAAE